MMKEMLPLARYGVTCVVLAACGPLVAEEKPGDGLSGGEPTPPPAETEPERDPPPPTPEELGSTGPHIRPLPEPESMAYWITKGSAVKLVIASWTADVCDDPKVMDPVCAVAPQWWLGLDLALPLTPGDYDLERSTGWAAFRSLGEDCDGEGDAALGRGHVRIDEVGDVITGTLVDAEVAFATAPITMAFSAPRCP
jgi:hypothetical protein